MKASHTVQVKYCGYRHLIATDLESLVLLVVVCTEWKYLCLLQTAPLVYLSSPFLSSSQLCLNLLDYACDSLAKRSNFLQGSPVCLAQKPVALNGVVSSSPTNRQTQVCPVSLPSGSSSPDSPFSFFLVPINRVLIVTSHPSPWRWSLSVGRKTQLKNSQQDGLLGASPEWYWVEASGGWSLVNRKPAPQHLEGKEPWFRIPIPGVNPLLCQSGFLLLLKTWLLKHFAAKSFPWLTHISLFFAYLCLTLAINLY